MQFSSLDSEEQATVVLRIPVRLSFISVCTLNSFKTAWAKQGSLTGGLLYEAFCGLNCLRRLGRWPLEREGWILTVYKEFDH